MEPRRFIFLDIDGVINHDKWYRYIHDNFRELGIGEWDKYQRHFCPENVQLLNQLEGCEVVISSSWCYNEELVQGLKNAGLNLPVIGCTIHYSLYDESLCRGNDIAKWFVENVSEYQPNDRIRHLSRKRWFEDREGNPFTYVIFDDYNDMLVQQQEHFIYINPKVGIRQKDINQAKKILRL